MSKIGLFKQEWIDIVFEGRNKKYGAYKLRSESPVTTSIALGIGIVLFVGLILSYHLPGLIGGMGNKEEEKEDIKLVELTELPEPPVEVLPPPPPVVQQQQAPKSIVEEVKLRPLEAAKKEEVPDEIPDTKDFKEADPSDRNAEASPEGDINIDKPSGDLKKGVEPVEDTGVYDSQGLQVKPSYPGGMEAFYKYVGANFRVPEIENMKTIKVYVYFVIEKDGSMSNVKALRDPGHGLGKEAERVLKSMKKKWEPGVQNGKNVRASFSLPITVNIRS
ncbi:energy transducer TonB [Flavobacterium sp. MFBS3-15]|uniref:energy transducer TonB n=1 Tax=Flavobacterium sp. MFBS3-15 TaxID=2989816 RepID=UPI0022361CB2|nr:energy transducer TonB [Flavobacterium sp. MFBS3-15]MCW4469413.1 energy transducer TonB [Flavobacterium sp. MFBS3-15]